MKIRLSALSAAVLLASLASAVHAESYQFHQRVSGIKPATTVAWGLSARALPEAVAGHAYSFAFADLITPGGLSGFAWNAQSLPDWASLDPMTGLLTGTPSNADAGSSQFTVTATRQDIEGQQIYTIVVDGQVLEVTQLSLGYNFTCGLTPAGGVVCWGGNQFGQLGNGTTAASAAPVKVSGLESGVMSISSGYYHTCVTLASGAPKCWGYGYHGQLGNGGASNRLTPVQVSTLSSGLSAIKAFAYTTCAIDSGNAKCWGRNTEGQVGDGSVTQKNTPVQVSGLTGGVTSIDGGQTHTCAVRYGVASCWGKNTLGQLGNGTNTRYLTPMPVSSMSSGVTRIDAEGDNTCAVVNGAAKCWGHNAYGQNGNGSTSNANFTPVAVSGLASGVVDISVGFYHACAKTSAGAMKCWGSNSNGQLGNGTNADRASPAQVVGLNGGVSSIHAGYYHTCAVAEGIAKCWGFNEFSQVGDRTSTNRNVPTDVIPVE